MARTRNHRPQRHAPWNPVPQQYSLRDALRELDQPHQFTVRDAVCKMDRHWREVGVDFAAGQRPSLQQVAEFWKLAHPDVEPLDLQDVAQAERELCAELGRALVAIERYRAWAASSRGATKTGSAVLLALFITLTAATVQRPTSA